MSGRLLMVGHRAQFEDCFGFELPHPLSRDIDLSTNLRKGERLFAIKTEAQAQDFLFALVQL